MTKRAFAEVSGHHLEQQRSKRKEEGHTMYGADGMECDEANVEKNGCMALLNEGDTETNAEVDSAGKISEASVIGLFSSEKDYSSSDAILDKEDDTLADSSRNCSEQSIVFSVARPYLVTNKECQRSNLSQSDQAPLSKVDQAFTSSDSSSEATHAATVNKHLSSDLLPVEKDRLLENFDTVFKESIIHEEFENHNVLKSTSLKPHNTSMKRRIDNMPDFTEYGPGRKVCQEPSLGANLVGALGSSIPVDITGGYPDSNKMILETNFSSNNLNSGVTELAVGFLEMKYNINGETASESYLNEGPSIKADMAEEGIVDRTLNSDSCSAEVVGQHKIGSMPLITECGNDENPEKEFRKTIKATVSEKMNCTKDEENPSDRPFSSAISIEINQKSLYANFKGELSLPPSPITGVIDCFVGKPNGHNNHLDSLNEEESAFSFQPPNKNFSKEFPMNEIGFEMQGASERVTESYDCFQNLTEHPLKVVSIGIHGDKITQQKERIAFVSFSSTLEDNLLPKEKKEEVQEIGSMPPERSFACRTRKKLLVLDLNGLLCDIVNDYHGSYRVEKKIGGKPFFKRPFCDDFLKFCFDNFHIGIWSSRRKYNVESALDYLMGEFKHELLFCWDQSKCTYTGARTIENHHKPLVLKELKKLWNKEESDLPWEKGDFSPSNTLLLDDSPYKALCNPPHTAIFPYPYQYTDERDNSLGPGGDIRVYLEHLLISDDVQRFVEEHSFGQPAITASDQHWYFYCQIIKSYATQLS